MNKEYRLKLDLNKRVHNNKMNFDQYDNNVNDFYIEVTQDGKIVEDLNKAVITLATIKPNGKVEAQFIKCENGFIYADLKPYMRDLIGNYQAMASIVLEDETIITDVISYTVNENKILSMLNDEVVSDERFDLLTDMLNRLSSIENNEEQRQINEADRIHREELRQLEEDKRVQAELVREHQEADREKAEAIRESQEYVRRQNEDIRIANEEARVKAESDRVVEENKRVEAETKRDDNYNFMTEDEERRRLEAEQHKANEEARKTEETKRVNEESKRRTTEQSRVSAENARSSKEVIRESNEEVRKANEVRRVDDEQGRKDRYDVFINDAENVANEFERYTKSAKVDEEQRKSNESTRQTLEDKRKSNEVERISNENSRKSAESNRVVVESNRVSEHNERLAKVNKAIADANNKIIEVDSAKNTMISSVNTSIDKMKSDVEVAKKDMNDTTNNKVEEIEDRFNTLTQQQQQDAEVIDARDSEVSLKARLDRDLYLDNIPLKDKIKDIEGMKQMQDMKYATDKGYLVCNETMDGVVKDIKVKGKTLVNKLKKSILAQGSLNSLGLNAASEIRVRTDDYIDINSNTTILTNQLIQDIHLYQSGEFVKRISTIEKTTYLLNSDNSFNQFKVIFKKVDNTVITPSECLSTVLEGDHTQNPPSYFEGLMSVGEDVDKIEVLSNNENLINKDDLKSNSTTVFPIVKNNGFEVDFTSAISVPYYQVKCVKDGYLNLDVIKKGSSDILVRGYKTISDLKTLSNFTFSKGVSSIGKLYEILVPNGTNLLAFHRGSSSTGLVEIDNIMVTFNSNPDGFIEHKQDKKAILYQDKQTQEWLPVNALHEWDVVDSVEGKWYKRSEKVVLDGSESNFIFQTSQQGINTSLITMSLSKAKEKSNLLSDLMPISNVDLWQPSTDYEGMFFTNNGHLQIRINKSKLETQDVAGFKKWLQANPVTVVYQLAQEEVYNIAPLNVDAYANETMISCNGGVIAPSMTFSITSYITNLIQANKERIKSLESEVFEEQQMQNSMIFDTDMRIMDIEFLLMDSMNLKINLRGDGMIRGINEYMLMKDRIESGNYTDEYLEKCLNKYKKAGRLTEEEYNKLYDMIYPPIYDTPIILPSI